MLQRKKNLFGLRLILNSTEHQKAVGQVQPNIGGKEKTPKIYIQLS